METQYKKITKYILSIREYLMFGTVNVSTFCMSSITKIDLSFGTIGKPLKGGGNPKFPKGKLR